MFAQDCTTSLSPFGLDLNHRRNSGDRNVGPPKTLRAVANFRHLSRKIPDVLVLPLFCSQPKQVPPATRDYTIMKKFTYHRQNEEEPTYRKTRLKAAKRMLG